MPNPFKPTAGARPPLLIGREDMREDFSDSIEDGPGAPGLLTIFTGPRGVGKTVMLGEMEDEAIEHDWVVISETATPGLVGRIAESIRLTEEELGDGPPSRRIKGVTVGPVRVDTQIPPDRQVHWRRLAGKLLDRLQGHQSGLLVTVDEIHAVDRTELSELAAVVQHLIRDNLPIALAVAGLPKAVSDLLDDGVSTFLRRAERYDLHSAEIPAVQDAFEKTFKDSGISIDKEQLGNIAEATGGYPFLIQLVGYHVWKQATKAANTVTDEALRTGVEGARQRMGATVLQSAYTSLSSIDQTYLLCMAEDEGPSSTSKIASRMAVGHQYAGVYRRRLIDAGVITPDGHGLVNFAVPRLREYLREQPGYGVHPTTPRNP